MFPSFMARRRRRSEGLAEGREPLTASLDRSKSFRYNSKAKGGKDGDDEEELVCPEEREEEFNARRRERTMEVKRKRNNIGFLSLISLSLPRAEQWGYSPTGQGPVVRGKTSTRVSEMISRS